MSDTDDERWARLMVAVQAGDRRCYDQLLREIVPVVRRVARRRWPMAQATEIDDVVQETLKSLHAARHTYIPGRPFLPWLVAIARHRATDEIRRNLRRRQRETDTDMSDETFLKFAPNTQYDQLADRDEIRKAIAQLPPGQRNAIRLLKLRGLSLKEASSLSGMSATALKVATHRAMTKLRLILRQEL